MIFCVSISRSFPLSYASGLSLSLLFIIGVATVVVVVVICDIDAVVHQI